MAIPGSAYIVCMLENENHDETYLQSDLLPFVHHRHRRPLENSSHIEAIVKKQKLGGMGTKRTNDIARVEKWLRV